MICDQTSPTIWVPAGMVMVSETMYVPASKNMILQPANWARMFLIAAVSSVFPSPCKHISFSASVCYEISLYLSTLRPNADEVTGSVASILRVRLADDTASAIEQDAGPVDRGNVILDEVRPLVGAMEGVALSP